MTRPVANLLLAGVTKAGTTSLFNALAQHPEICAGREKQLAYFSPIRFGEPVEPRFRYEDDFAACAGQRYRIDATPNYFDGGQPLIDAVVEVCGRPRVVLSLRDPADRVWSSYRYAKSRARLGRDVDYRTYVDESRRLFEARRHLRPDTRTHSAFGTGFYAEELRRWAAAFGPDLRVVLFDDVKRDVGAVVAGVVSWLGLDPSPVGAFDLEPRNRTVAPIVPGLRRVAETVLELAEPALARVPALRRRMVGAYHALNSRDDREELPEEVDREVREAFRRSNREVAAVLRSVGHADLPGWLADA